MQTDEMKRGFLQRCETRIIMKKIDCLGTDADTASKLSDGQLVDGNTLLEIIFPKKSRPTLRWLRDQQELRRVPYRKIGRLVFFDPDEVRAAWRDRFTVGQTTGGNGNPNN
jgi:hypothetical protein